MVYLRFRRCIDPKRRKYQHGTYITKLGTRCDPASHAQKSSSSFDYFTSTPLRPISINFFSLTMMNAPVTQSLLDWNTEHSCHSCAPPTNSAPRPPARPQGFHQGSSQPWQLAQLLTADDQLDARVNFETDANTGNTLRNWKMNSYTTRFQSRWHKGPQDVFYVWSIKTWGLCRLL